MFVILFLIVITVSILYLFRSKDNTESENKFKNYFNKSKEFIFIICMIILSYSIKNCEVTETVSNNIPDVYADNVKF